MRSCAAGDADSGQRTLARLRLISERSDVESSVRRPKAPSVRLGRGTIARSALARVGNGFEPHPVAAIER